MLPVMWAVNSPLRPRKPMVSVDPAITLSTNGSARMARSAAADAVPNHLFRIDDFVKALLVNGAGSKRRVLQGQVLVIRLVGNRGRLVIPDYRAQSGHQHQRAVDHLVDVLAVEPGAFDRELPQLLAGIAEDAGRMEEIVDDDRAHRVELEIPLAAGKGDGVVLADHLDADHDHRLLLGRIDLARHDRGARLVFWQQ